MSPVGIEQNDCKLAKRVEMSSEEVKRKSHSCTNISIDHRLTNIPFSRFDHSQYRMIRNLAVARISPFRYAMTLYSPASNCPQGQPREPSAYRTLVPQE